MAAWATRLSCCFGWSGAVTARGLSFALRCAASSAMAASKRSLDVRSRSTRAAAAAAVAPRSAGAPSGAATRTRRHAGFLAHTATTPGSTPRGKPWASIGFLFELYASRGGKQSQRAVAEMLISVSGACGATLGTKMPDINALEGKARDAIDALAKLIPKDMQSTASKKEPSASMYLTFAQFWDLCQDDVDIAKYIDGVLALRKNETRIGHREQRLDLAAMHTLDAALMDENEDEAESENSSDAELPEGAKVAELAERHEAEGGDDRDAPAERKEKEGERPSGILARHRPPLFMGTIDDYLENDPVDVKSPVLADGTVYVALFTLLERSQLAMPLIRRGALVGVVSAAHALDQVVSRLLDAMEEAGDVRVDAACAATKKRF